MIKVMKYNRTVEDRGKYVNNRVVFHKTNGIRMR